MATSSSGGSTLRQWQRFLTLLRQYLLVKNSRVKSTLTKADSISSSIGGVPSHPLVKSSSAVEPHTAAALQALNLYFQQLTARGQSVVEQKKTEDAEPMNSSSSLSIGAASPPPPHAAASTTYPESHQTKNYSPLEIRATNVLEFLGDGHVGTQDVSKRDARIGHFASTSSLHPYEDIGSEHSTYGRMHYPASAPLSKVSSPMARPSHGLTAANAIPGTTSSSVHSDSVHPFLQPSSPDHKSIQKPHLAVPAPTYSTIRIPVVPTSKASNRLVSCKTDLSTTNSTTTTSNSVVKTAATTTTSSTAITLQPVAQETELQKALRTVNSYIPYSLSSLLRVNLTFLRSTSNGTKTAEEKNLARPQWLDMKRDIISKASIDSRTRHLVRGVTGDSEAVLLRRLNDLCHHLRAFPHTKGAAVKCGAVGRVLRVLTSSQDQHVAEEARAALTLLGYAGPVRGRGLKLLTIDGGGVRGLVAIELLRRLEQQTGRPIHEMFDFICGVSTGAIIAVLVGVHRLPLDECEELYRDLSNKVFKQTTLRGATGLVMNRSYYDSKAWDVILQENMGEMQLLASAAADEAPKLCLVACHAVRLMTQAYLFRNYVLPYRVASHYTGTSNAKVWEAVRASAAAPGYFSEFRLGDKALMDGGILVNNPAAIAVHEARQLWPDEPFQCVVSLGTGRCQPMDTMLVGEGAPGGKVSTTINWSDKLRSVINSATDTEGVHTVLHDLLPSNVYFRFNPHLTDEFALDETRPERVAAMTEDTQLYARKNAIKFEEVATALNKVKTPYHKARDYVKKGRLLHGFDVEG